MITDTHARRIAAEWHGGLSSAMYAFASSGFIAPDLEAEITHELEIDRNFASVEEKTPLIRLLDYVRVKGERGPVDGWSNLSW